MSKTILILGCGTMQLPALTIARDMGWTVVAADGNPNAEGRPLAHHFYPIDLKDSDALIDLGLKLRQGDGLPGRLDGVFTAGTDFSLSVAHVAEALGLPGHSVNAARRATDKLLMRRCFKENKVPSPDFAEVGETDDPAVLSRQVPGPWVVKPVDSMGSRGVVLIDRSENLSEALSQARRYSRSRRALLETYVDGSEYSLDALVEDGRLIRCGLADRHICYPPFFIEIGHTIPSAVSEEVADTLWEAFEKGIAALGLSRGAAKGDIKLGSGGPVIGEIAARLSGGYMSGWTYPYSSGIEPTRGALRLAVGMSAQLPSPSEALICAERALISIDGRLRGFTGEKEAQALPGIKEIFLRHRIGDQLVFPRNNVEKAGNIIAVGQTRAEAAQRAQNALALINLELDPAEKSTGLYLDSFGPFPPDAWDMENTFLSDLWRRFPPSPSQGCPVLQPSIPLPAALEQTRAQLPTDAAGRNILDALEILRQRRMIKIETTSDWTSANQTSSDFWKALSRGGLPGVRWYLEQAN